MSVSVTVDLTKVPPGIHLSRNEYSEEPLWHLEIFPNKEDGSECVAFLADSPADVMALGVAIVEAARKALYAPVDGAS